MTWDPVTALRLRLLDDHTAAIAELDAREREASRELRRPHPPCRLHPQRAVRDRRPLRRRAARGDGDPRRFAGEGGFARFNGTAPLPASSAEGDDEPKRHRLNRGGNRRINAVLHRMAVTQLRCEPRARQIYDDARRRGHTKKEAMRILKRHLSNVVYRRMIRDLNATLISPPVDTRQAAA